MSDASSPSAGPRPATTAGIGAVLIALAVAVVFDAQRLPPAGAFGVGPAAAMRVVAALLALLGVAHLVVAWRQPRSDGAADADDSQRGPLAWVLGGLVGLMLILQLQGGFIAAATWLFVCTARGFGAPIGAKSIGIGAALSAAVFLFFTKALSLGLPAGPLERLFA